MAFVIITSQRQVDFHNTAIPYLASISLQLNDALQPLIDAVHPSVNLLDMHEVHASVHKVQLSQMWLPASLHSCALQAFPHRSLDTTAERHFAEILRDHMLEEIELVEGELQTQVKAIITDAASDCRKARSLVVQRIPRILSLDCFAHQV